MTEPTSPASMPGPHAPEPENSVRVRRRGPCRRCNRAACICRTPGGWQYARIEYLSGLQPGWDSYGAEKISKAALRTADALAFCPTSGGGMSIELHAGGMDIEIGIESSGRVVEVNVMPTTANSLPDAPADAEPGEKQ